MRFGGTILFEEVTCSFLPGRRYAITGPNGAGEVYFDEDIGAGKWSPPKGSVTRPKKIGVLPRISSLLTSFGSSIPSIMGNEPLWGALVERDGFMPRLTNPVDRRGGHATR